MTDKEFQELEELAKDIKPEYQALINATTEQEKEVFSGVIGKYDPKVGS